MLFQVPDCLTKAHAPRSRSFIGTDPPCTERQLWEMHVKFGADPRSLALYAHNPDRYESIVVKEIIGASSDDLRYSSYNPDSTHHHIFVISPLPTNRCTFQKTIASRHVFELLWEWHLKDQIPDMKYFYSRYRGDPTTAPIAGSWIFESRVHQLLRKEQEIRVLPLTPAGPRRRGPITSLDKRKTPKSPPHLRLPSSDEQSLAGGLSTGSYYRPKSANFPTIDSLLLARYEHTRRDVLLLFRIAYTTEKINVSKDSLRGIDELVLPQINTTKWYMVVTPEGVEPKVKVPFAYFGMEGGGFPHGKGISLFHYPVPADVLFLPNQSNDA